MSQDTELTNTKARLRSLLRRAPDSVINGSYNTTVKYKKLAGEANKLLAMPRPNLLKLTSVYNSLAAYS